MCLVLCRAAYTSKFASRHRGSVVGLGGRWRGGRAGPKLLPCLGTSLAAEAAAWLPMTMLLFTLISDLPESFHPSAPRLDLTVQKQI